LLKRNDRPDELNVRYKQSFIFRYVIPYAFKEKDIAGLAKLYAWSRHESVKKQALQNLKQLLHDPECIQKEKLWRHVANMERILRPRRDDPQLKDKNITMLFLEVYRIVISLLYVAIISGKVNHDAIDDILKQGQEANAEVDALAQDLYQLGFDHDQVLSHTSIIGTFLTKKLHTAEDQKKSKTLRMLVKNINYLVESNLTVDEQRFKENGIKSSIKDLTDTFHQHVIFHYLVIVVSVVVLLILLLSLTPSANIVASFLAIY